MISQIEKSQKAKVSKNRESLIAAMASVKEKRRRNTNQRGKKATAAPSEDETIEKETGAV